MNERNIAKMRRLLNILFITVIHFVISGCTSESRLTVIKLAHGLDPSHPVHHAMKYLAEQVAEKSEGQVRIDIYPSEQLGSERECIELLQIGSLGMTKVSTSVIESFVPSFKVFSLPYLFRDDEHRFKVLEGEIGKGLLLECEKFLVRGLCYYDAGSRSFYTKEKPILTPDDLTGLKIRIQESPTSMRMIQALGGSPTPIAWGELYTALQQGVVDAAENNPPTFYFSHHYEVCDYYSLDEHTSVPDILLVSNVVWRDLSQEARTWLQEAADESAEYQKELWKEATARAYREVQKAGVKILYPDKTIFSKKVGNLYEEYRTQPETYELIQQVRSIR